MTLFSGSDRAIRFGLTACAILAAMAGSSAPAQTPALVKNINQITTTNASSSPGTPVRQGSLAFFVANDGTHGTELWVTDGSEAGTHLVLDINPGAANANILNITPIGTDKVVFSANDGTSGAELWISDGTAANTMMVADINPGSGSSTPGQGVGGIIAFDANTVFFAATGPSGTELYRTDGTPVGTTLVLDIETGSGSSTPSRLTLFNNKVFFRAAKATLGGAELWSTDGSPGGTARVADLSPGGDSSPDLLTVSGPRLFFIATVASDIELYASDGTTAALVKNTNPSGSGLSTAGFLIDIGGTLFFAATDGVNGRELWTSDGTPGGTNMVVDLNPGSGDSIPTTSVFAANRNGQLLYSATSGTGGAGTELWTSDGTAGNTTLVKDINPGTASSSPVNFRIVGSGANARLFCSATDAVIGQELCVSDGTAAGTAMVFDSRLNSNGSPLALADFNGVLLFSVEDSFVGRELFRSDGTVAGTALVKDIRQPNTSAAAFSSDLTGATTRAIGAVGNRLFIRATDGIAGQELWVSDSTAAGTLRVGDLNPGSADATPAGITDVGGRPFFTAFEAGHGTELFSIDTMGAPYRVKEINAGATSGLATAGNLTNLNGLAIFVGTDGTGDELWKSDGTDGGTVKIQDINASAGINASSPFVLGNRLYIAATGDAASAGASASVSSLWVTDGNTVSIAADLATTQRFTGPSNFAALNGRLYFAATGATGGNELWSYDPTANTVALVKDINTTSGTASSGPRALVALSGKLYFTASDGTSGIELWQSDGTAPGTVRVADIQTGTSGGLTNTTPLSVVGDKLFFFATNTSSNLEPWVYDPASGMPPHMLKGPGGINPSNTSGSVSTAGVFADVNGIAHFAASDTGTSTLNTELWRSDGTDAGTVLVGEIDAAGNSGVRNLRTVLDGPRVRLFFTASDGLIGEELYVLTACRADFNTSGVLEVQDIFDFLNAWFAGQNRADFNGGGLAVQDIFDFLNAWFAGC
jgi:ELWxxDGT repeat protein